MGSARTEITGLLMQPTALNDVFWKLDVTENVAKQWIKMCYADEVVKVLELNQ